MWRCWVSREAILLQLDTLREWLVRWAAARAFLDARPDEAFSDRVMLEVACTLAIGRFEPLGLDDENRAAVVRAVKSVLEVE
jgi:hypothetical protein